MLYSIINLIINDMRLDVSTFLIHLLDTFENDNDENEECHIAIKHSIYYDMTV